MSTNYLCKTFSGVLATLLLNCTSAQASAPLWTFSPIGATSISIAPTQLKTISYRVTNQSSKSHTLKMIPIPGIRQVTTVSTDCKSTFVLGPQQYCTLNLEVNGSKLRGSISGGPVLCQNGSTAQCYQPTKGNSLNIRLIHQPPPTPKVSLTASTSAIGLSVACSQVTSGCAAVNPALTGKPRIITFINQGPDDTTDFSIKSNLPSDTKLSMGNCGKVLKANSTCTITITPGAKASSAANNTPCTSGEEPTTTITASANGATKEVKAFVLGYGCIYQGGYIYAIDDTTQNTQSIGGNVLNLVDQVSPSTGIIWSSNGNGSASGDVDTVAIGTDQTTTSPCNGGQDGSCDTNLIVNYYNANRAQGGSAPTPLNYYAAGVCMSIMDTYSNWYLPAICEWGPATLGLGSDCPAGIQNITDNLSILVGNLSASNPSTSCPAHTNCLFSFYWSSTETNKAPYPPAQTAWFEYYDASGTQNPFSKGQLLGVRCVRALTP